MRYFCLNKALRILDSQSDTWLNKRSEIAFTKLRRKLKKTENGIETFLYAQLSFKMRNCHLKRKIEAQMRLLRALD